MRTQISTLLLGGIVFTSPLFLLTSCEPDIPQATSADVPGTSAEKGVSAAPDSDSADSADSDLNGPDAPDFLTATDPEADPAVKGITALHNQARAAVIPKPVTAIPALTWNTTVTAAAQKVANTCVFKHSGNGYGENIYAAAGSSPTPTAVVKSWTSESVNYTYSTNSCASGKVCGHYTQVVWRGSKQLGCAQKTCTINSPFTGFPTWYFWVCNYSPAGNIIGQKPY